ncbi:MAG: DUF3368 domain-containing protein, partial [Oscillospiraceae bacterium]|nr:DUF3368 domain-containing protein [Oscillospiraceae bacterium]
MRKTVVVNSTPMIALREIGRLEILRDLYSEIVIPGAVCREVSVKDTHFLDGFDWIRTFNIT